MRELQDGSTHEKRTEPQHRLALQSVQLNDRSQILLLSCSTDVSEQLLRPGNNRLLPQLSLTHLLSERSAEDQELIGGQGMMGITPRLQF